MEKIFSSSAESRELEVLFSRQKSGGHRGMRSPEENEALGRFRQGETAGDLFNFLSARAEVGAFFIRQMFSASFSAGPQDSRGGFWAEKVAGRVLGSATRWVFFV